MLSSVVPVALAKKVLGQPSKVVLNSLTFRDLLCMIPGFEFVKAKKMKCAIVNIFLFMTFLLPIVLIPLFSFAEALIAGVYIAWISWYINVVFKRKDIKKCY